MSKQIYGIDLDGVITPLMVRDAIITCFIQAHCADSGFDIKEKDINEKYCQSIVENAFEDVGVDFNNPTKESIFKVLEKLADFGKKFRDQKVVKEHYDNIIFLANKMK